MTGKKREEKRSIIDIDGSCREYHFNNTKYLVESRFVNASSASATLTKRW